MKDRDLKLWMAVNGILRDYALIFNLSLKDIRPIKKKDRGLYVASCSEQGRIRMDLRNRFGKRFDAYHLIDTMSHELAHLKYQNHSAQWFNFHLRILTEMEQDRVYVRLRKLLKKKH